MSTYATLAELKSWSAVPSSSTSDDIELQVALDAAARQIDQLCGRTFDDAGSASARVFAAATSGHVTTDDFSAVTTIKTDSSGNGTYDTTWTAADYQLEPLNGVTAGLSGVPYWRIRAVGTRSFPVWREARVQVTATWGWAAVPAPIKHATLILALRLWKRRDTPEGVLGFSDFGGVRVTPVDRDVEALIAPYKRVDAWV